MDTDFVPNSADSRELIVPYSGTERALAGCAHAIYQAPDSIRLGVLKRKLNADLKDDANLIEYGISREDAHLVDLTVNALYEIRETQRRSPNTSFLDIAQTDGDFAALGDEANRAITDKVVHMAADPVHADRNALYIVRTIMSAPLKGQAKARLIAHTLYAAESIKNGHDDPPEILREREQAQQFMLEAHDYLDYVYGKSAILHFLNTSIMRMTERRNSWMRDMTDFMERRYNMDNSRLQDECAKYQVGGVYAPEYRESLRQMSDEEVLTGYVHAAIQTQLDRVLAFMEATPDDKDRLEDMLDFRVMVMVDETHVKHARYDLKPYLPIIKEMVPLIRDRGMALHAIDKYSKEGKVVPPLFTTGYESFNNRLIAKKSKTADLIEVDLARNPINAKSFQEIPLSDWQRAELHAICYQPRSKRLRSSLYKQFYMPNGKSPNMIINFHRNNPQGRDKSFGNDDAKMLDVHDPYSLGNTAEADMCINVIKNEGTAAVKFNHRIFGLAAREMAWTLLARAPDAAARIALAREKISAQQEYQGLEKISVPEPVPTTELEAKPVLPLLEAVAVDTFKGSLYKYEINDDKGKKIKISPSQSLQFAVAVANWAEYVHVQVDATDSPFAPSNPEQNNLHSPYITLSRLYEAKKPADVLNWCRQTTRALYRAKRGYSDPALLANSVGEMFEPKLTPISPRFHPGILPVLDGRGQLSAIPIIAPTHEQQAQAKIFQLQVFESARPAVQTRAPSAFSLHREDTRVDGPLHGFFTDSIGIVGIVNDIATGEYHVSTRLEPGDIPQTWGRFADVISSAPGEQDNVRLVLEPVIKNWQKLCHGKISLGDYLKHLDRGYNSLFGKIKDSYTLDGKDYTLDSSDDLQQLLNAILQRRANSIVSSEQVQKGYAYINNRISTLPAAKVIDIS